MAIMTEAQLKKGRTMLRNGHSTREIAQELGVTVKTIRYSIGVTRAYDSSRKRPPEASIEAKLAREAARARQSDISLFLGEPPPGFSALDQRINGTDPRNSS